MSGKRVQGVFLHMWSLLQERSQKKKKSALKVRQLFGSKMVWKTWEQISSRGIRGMRGQNGVNATRAWKPAEPRGQSALREWGQPEKVVRGLKRREEAACGD